MDIVQQMIEAASQMSILEIIAVVAGISSVLFSRKENILVYPTGILSVLIYIYICFDVKLYADMGINVFYFFMSIYGWVTWSSKTNQKQLEISSNTKKENLIGFVCTLLLWSIFYYILSNFTDSDVPVIDSLTTSLCFVGMWFMAWKKLENWTYWIIADLISIPLYWYKGLYLTSFQFLIFTILATLGYIEWKKKISH